MKTPPLLSRRALATTVSGLAITVPILVGGTMPVEFATPAHARRSSAVRCQTAKFAAAAKFYSGAQKCLAQSLIHTLPPSPCLQTVGAKFDAAFVKADTLGWCSGTASAMRPRVEAQALEAASLILCPSGNILCGTACVDAWIDPNNCGTCGNTCSGGLACLSGQCATTCATDDQCALGFYCGGTPPLCIAQGDTGAPCSANDQCASDTCFLGMCICLQCQ